MLVAVIDDGIDTKMYSIGPLRYDMYVTATNRVREQQKRSVEYVSHGTTVAGIVKKYAPEVELCSINIFPKSHGKRLNTTCGKLVAALRWCLKMGVPVINLSLGTVDPKDFKRIQNIVNKLLDNGQVIVAACNKDGRYTVPAMLPGVLGVKADENLCGDEYYVVDNGNRVEYMASASHELVWAGNICFKTPPLNSYAAPTITAAVVKTEIQLRSK